MSPAFAKTIFKNPKLAVAQTVGFLKITQILEALVFLVPPANAPSPSAVLPGG